MDYDLPGTANARILWGTGRGNYYRDGGTHPLTVTGYNSNGSIIGLTEYPNTVHVCPDPDKKVSGYFTIHGTGEYYVVGKFDTGISVFPGDASI